MRVLVFSLAAALAACSPPATKAPDAPAPEPGPSAAACNSLAPDLTRMVAVEDEAAAALPAADLRGGPIAPGTYDLVRAVRIGAATGWRATRAAVLAAAESEAGVVLNWAGAAAGEALDTWTATLTDSPATRITYSCGRIGEVAASYLARPDGLELRIEDGAGGSLHLVFAKRP